MSKPDLQRKATAFHEAAHAVVGVMLGLDLGYVTLDPDDVTLLGLCQFTCDEEDVRIDAFLIESLAGKVAEMLCVLQSVASGARYDRGLVIDVLARRYAESEQARVQALALLEAHAVKLVLEAWDTIAVVAHELLDSGTLKGEEVAQIVGHGGR